MKENKRGKLSIPRIIKKKPRKKESKKLQKKSHKLTATI